MALEQLAAQPGDHLAAQPRDHLAAPVADHPAAQVVPQGPQPEPEPVYRQSRISARTAATASTASPTRASASHLSSRSHARGVRRRGRRIAPCESTGCRRGRQGPHASRRLSRSPPASRAAVAHAAITASPVHGAIRSVCRGTRRRTFAGDWRGWIRTRRAGSYEPGAPLTWARRSASRLRRSERTGADQVPVARR